jgi:hypothetical protein
MPIVLGGPSDARSRARSHHPGRLHLTLTDRREEQTLCPRPTVRRHRPVDSPAARRSSSPTSRACWPMRRTPRCSQHRAQSGRSGIARPHPGDSAMCLAWIHRDQFVHYIQLAHALGDPGDWSRFREDLMRALTAAFGLDAEYATGQLTPRQRNALEVLDRSGRTTTRPRTGPRSSTRLSTPPEYLTPLAGRNLDTSHTGLGSGPTLPSVVDGRRKGCIRCATGQRSTACSSARV